ncbi:hypothetical protein QYF61_020593 [Mycteria americana]|nr:hypothetical protein QYF61_020593 [Mycteria americana]
MNRDIFN